jgi:hypothetical protein
MSVSARFDAQSLAPELEGLNLSRAGARHQRGIRRATCSASGLGWKSSRPSGRGAHTAARYAQTKLLEAACVLRGYNG